MASYCEALVGGQGMRGAEMRGRFQVEERRAKRCVCSDTPISKSNEVITEILHTLPELVQHNIIQPRMLPTLFHFPPYPGSYFLLSAPSFCIPSHPTKLPTFSSTPPNPCFDVSLFSPAFFIASTACVLS